MRRIGLIGLGVMGRTHLRVLGELTAARVVAAADTAAAALVGLGQLTTYDDPLTLVREADVDAVLVASADPSHAALVLACLERELPVLCEKPLTTSVADARRIVDREVTLRRRLVQVGFMRRFDPAFALVHNRVRAGAVGDPAVVHTVHRNPLASYAFSPTVLVTNSASHDVDLVRWLTGDEVVEAHCQATPGGSSRFASVLLRLTLRSGALASIELTYGPGYVYDVRCDVVGSEGSLASQHQQVEGDWVNRFDAAYRLQDTGWVAADAVDPVGASAYDGLVNSLVLDAAARSLETGRPARPELPSRPELYV